MFTKEPDTVAWIGQFKPGEVFVDIGANVRTYAILAAKGHGARVFAFEPESQNYASLNRNVMTNQVQDLCIAFPLALGDRVQVDRLYLSEFGLGGSCHTFGENIDFHLNSRTHETAKGCVSFLLDQLVSDNVIPQPDHIKIDVDGLEHVVLVGVANVLAHVQLKSILVELNTHLVEHLAIVDQLYALGFETDHAQIKIVVRDSGAFQGVGNYIFYKPDAGISFKSIIVPEPVIFIADANRLRTHVADRIVAMELISEPYPFFYVEEIFPTDYYAQMMAMKPDSDELVGINELGRTFGCDERSVLTLDADFENTLYGEKRRFWESHRDWFLSEELMVMWIRRFHAELMKRGLAKLNLRPEAMFMRDVRGYQLGPHTDLPQRLMSVMFYLPDDAAHSDIGTSVYLPEDRSLRSEDTQHFKPTGFEEIFRAPFVPNSAFSFLKTDNSFHGVKPLGEDYDRDTLVYIIKHKS